MSDRCRRCGHYHHVGYCGQDDSSYPELIGIPDSTAVCSCPNDPETIESDMIIESSVRETVTGKMGVR